MIVLMKKNDANTVRGLKEMVEAAFRDLQTGAKQPDLGKRLRGCRGFASLVTATQYSQNICL